MSDDVTYIKPYPTGYKLTQQYDDNHKYSEANEMLQCLIPYLQNFMNYAVDQLNNILSFDSHKNCTKQHFN